MGKQSTLRAISDVQSDGIPFDVLMEANAPVILRGLASGWRLVEAGIRSPGDIMSILEESYNGQPVGVFEAPPGSAGRFTYNDDCTAFNFTSKRANLVDILARIRSGFNTKAHPYFYINSLSLDAAFPGIHSRGELSFEHPALQGNIPSARIWIGTESVASAHYDMPNNIACCVSGRRRFTLFPPEQIHNLYPGPLDPTPGGQVVSMVDFSNPDFERFPRFRQALDTALVADLEPGDGLFYPSMWWHHVQAMAPFNVMINYWWVSSPAYMGNPLDIVLHAILGLRDRPPSEKEAWREVLDFYVFGATERATEHLPDEALGYLGSLDSSSARRLRAYLRQRLNQ